MDDPSTPPQDIAATPIGPGAPAHESEPHGNADGARLNRLRAGVLGANDGIVSVAGLVVGVAGATTAVRPLLTAGVAGLVAGAVSMALGEFVSVSSQRDSEKAMVALEREELIDDPEGELAELAAIYQRKGLSASTARTVAAELTAHDVVAAHVEAELGIDPGEWAGPRQAAVASAVSFTVGAFLPLVAILLPSAPWRVPITIVAVLVALAATGFVSARLGGAATGRAMARVVVGGGLGLAATYAIGHVLGATVG